MLSPSSRRLTPGRSRLGPSIIKHEGAPKVRVVARVRPFLVPEIANSQGEPWNCTTIVAGADSEETLHVLDEMRSRKEVYRLDACYGERASNSDIFSKELDPILPSLYKGCNATVFAYGATCSGKSHTMQGNEKDPGLMLLAVKGILMSSRDKNSKVEISYYEVYLDRCYDLLEPKREVVVMEDGNGNIQLRGLAQVQVRSVEDFHAIFKEGCSKRRNGSTGLNDASRRGHGILCVIVTTADDSSSSLWSVGKLNMIDLAGNEDNRRACNEGVRLAENSRINQSLFALSNVINALNANETRIPYRDSKLTRILQDSLGGTSRSLMIACLNPGSFTEAAHTLSFATRSKQMSKHSSNSRQVDDPVIDRLDMAAKLQAWRDAKSKLQSRTCDSPVQTKPFIPQSPTNVRSPKTPAIQRLLIERSSTTNSRPPLKCSEWRCTPPPKELSGMESEAVVMKAEKDVSINIPSEDATLSTVSTSTVDERGSISLGYVANKENQVMDFLCPATPTSHRSDVSDTPLSASLLSLTTKLRGALTPLSPSLANSIPFNSPPAQDTGNKICSEGENSQDCSTLKESDSLPENFSDSPFKKFNKCNATLRSLLMKEYLEVLNTAPRDQLLQLKGFGEKRVDSIMTLRETSTKPLKEIEDLAKIGLSVKQAHTIFNSNVMRQVSFDS